MTGPGGAGTTPITSLTIGSASGAANSLNLSTGAISVTGPAGTTINATGALNVGTSTFSTTALAVTGSVSVADGGSLTLAAATVAVGGVANLSGASSGQITNLTLARGSAALGSQTIQTLTVYGGTPVAGLLRHFTFNNGVAADVQRQQRPGNPIQGRGCDHQRRQVQRRLPDLGAATSNAYLQIGVNGNGPTIGNNYTLTAWYEDAAPTNGNGRTLWRGDDNNIQNGGDHPVYVNGGGNNVGLWGNTSGGGFDQAGAGQLPDGSNNNGVWHFLAVVNNNGVQTFYTNNPDGSLQVLGTVAKNMNTNNLGGFGGYGNGWNQSFAAGIDDGWVYNTALSTVDLTALMNDVSAPSSLSFNDGSQAHIATFNYASSNSVNVPLGASVGTLAASISAGSVTFNNTNLMPSLAVSGGNVNLARRTGLTNLAVSGGQATVGAAAAVTTASVTGGVANFSNTAPMTSLTVSGGSATFGAGVQAATATFSGGTANTNGNFLAVNNTLNVVTNAATIGLTGNNSFAVKGSNLAANIDVLQLKGGTTTLSYLSGGAGLDVRGWQNGGGTLVFAPDQGSTPDMTFTTVNPAGASNNSTYAHNLNHYWCYHQRRFQHPPGRPE